MASTIYNLDTANLFCGDDQPENSQHLVINTIKIPNLEVMTKAWIPGGGVMAIEVGQKRINAPMLGFNLAGINPDVSPRFMQQRRVNYTVRGNLFDVQSQQDIPLVAVVSGKMTKVDISNFSKDDGVTSDYEIREVVKYSLFVNNVEKFYFDFFSGPAGVRIDGENPFRDAAVNLGLL